MVCACPCPHHCPQAPSARTHTPPHPLSIEQVIVQKLLGTPFEMGYNAMDDTIEDLLAAGVIDPAKVTKNGLLNSCSIAGIMLTTQVSI